METCYFESAKFTFLWNEIITRLSELNLLILENEHIKIKVSNCESGIFIFALRVAWNCTELIDFFLCTMKLKTPSHLRPLEWPPSSSSETFSHVYVITIGVVTLPCKPILSWKL